jgi:hypothetical protein
MRDLVLALHWLLGTALALALYCKLHRAPAMQHVTTHIITADSKHSIECLQEDGQ